MNEFWAAVGGFFKGINDFLANDPRTFLGTLVNIAIIIVLAFVIRWALHFVVQRVVRQIVSGVKKTQNVDDTQAIAAASPLAAVRLVQRTRTLGSVLTNIINVTIFTVTVLLIINQIDQTVLGSFALLTAAVGAGLGFGAQNIVKDALNGLFMVMEDQLGVGDVVDVGPTTGVVEAVGIRITQIRDVNGTLWFVRNGEILRVGNMSQGWARVIIDLAVPYDTDIEAVEALLLNTATEMATSTRWRSRMLEKPEVWGLESISDDALVIRLVAKTRTVAKDDVSRELRSRLKAALDAADIKLPALNSIVLSGFDSAASVKGAHPPRTRPVKIVENLAPHAPRAPRPRKNAPAQPATPPSTPPTTPPSKPGKPSSTKPDA
ncbi:mechanosensitive ion channel family protein [Microterricola pindariensis]|uniref:Mechanosensitive ion channel protein MscS n=1 Tax=Microterricola pindariensis TaxID=478010 RepID=A0ABX5AUC1_9MICO|nr:mechanosensitive ion channel domain-containing protein [Microterricola pindariensis]PPL18329.1 mechanosensitive ion channel protein MscS [Microterricola pindariensis]